ncbi:replication protein A 70 kDa DNA-binding subunit-like isoform X6 [Xiphias gladius]|uniref:replication protein A 70 kDa DNA-binding subunit-like isoform X4 n=1 Tax=Xiphias gladius TaxID=8245 RepID=UPI001A98FB19|nr:replication protein A 70 kDa DNA-binding subunit-like isoform X4 [Xiphias gladius]XP_040006827.1 replication protein A 70 kDa DNA-binding subunit-like isoform X5 [Xiphias gladius]XP_040006828.1 replication protein A 70 kDa DNA-binding subunit-like isoform X6 [Xiphias gladius]
MSVTLTQGAIEALFNGSELNNPVLQLLSMRQISNASGPPRFRLMMSDGQHYWSSFLLATQLNTLAEENLLVPNCVCTLKKTITNTLSDGRHVVIVMGIEILQSAEETGGKIGNPTAYNADDKTSCPQNSGSGTSVSASPPSAAVPGPSYKNNSTAHSPPRGRGRGFVGKSPKKAPPMTFSPKKASPMTFSPTKASPMTFSPTKATSTSPGSSAKVIPIANLNPYLSKWTIRARVTNKSNVRTWNNSRGEGKLFSFEIVDESGEIKITAFNKEVDKFFSLVEQGKVYYISKATLKVANKQYTTLKNDYEMTLHAHSSIIPCDDSQGVPTAHCDFVPIAELENRDKDAIIDIIGVCKSAEDVSRITTKTSREVSKRALNLIDTTGKVVTVTLWGDEAEKFDGSGQPVVAIKGARLSDFGGRSLSALFSSTVMVNPDIPEAFRLRAWYDQKGYALNSQSLTNTRSAGSEAKMNWKTLSDVKSEHMGQGEKAEYFSCVATVLYTRKENCLYQACPSADCNKKVIDQKNGLYRCEKCNREFPNFKYRLLLSANLADFGDNQWVTCFQETAEALLGHSAETLGQFRDTDEAAFDEVFQKANFTTHIFKNRVKLETYNEKWWPPRWWTSGLSKKVSTGSVCHFTALLCVVCLSFEMRKRRCCVCTCFNPHRPRQDPPPQFNRVTVAISSNVPSHFISFKTANCLYQIGLKGINCITRHNKHFNH